jgi:hypothetical protein
MATSTSVPVEEYLRTTYHPDMEYVDGELVERHVGEHKHSRLQTLIGGHFLSLERAHKLRVLTEQRLRVHIWTADPYKHTVQEADREGIRYCADLAPEADLVGCVDFNALFAKVDEPTE